MSVETKKTALVTGGNSGMGKATVEALSDKGYKVSMLCRSKERGELALKDLKQKKERDIELLICDLGDMNEIREFTKEYVKNHKLDVLVNNAGVIYLDRRQTNDGLEMQFGVNHIGHFLLTLRLLSCMNNNARIINVSSGAYKIGKIHFNDYNLQKGYNVIKAYSQSKLANILFTKELASRISKIKVKNIYVNSCHPGAVATNMGVDRKTGFGKTITKMLRPFFKTPKEGAKTAIYLATSQEVKNITGEYFYNCKIKKLSKNAKSKKDAKKLFALSEKITGEFLIL